MEDRATMDSFIEMESKMESILDAQPERIIADLHPSYLSSQWARQSASKLGIPCMFVQHHHAHLGALAAEHAWDDSAPLLGWTFDGTGYGSDGTIWGGEAFVMERGNFERIATLERFLLPAGDAAVRFPFRVALALLHGSDIEWTDDLECVLQSQPPSRGLLRKQLERNVHVVPTTSMGRLFDGVASLLDVRHSISYEAQAAIELEEVALAADGATDLSSELRWMQEREDPVDFLFPTRACIRELVGGMRRGVPRPQLAHWFHRVVASWMVVVASRIREERQIQDIGLTGGVFQNRLLTSLAVRAFQDRGFRVLVHESWPCHDGSIGLGQAWIATRTAGYRGIDLVRSHTR
jgi:hydrogenase maturation protein HypF